MRLAPLLVAPLLVAVLFLSACSSGHPAFAVLKEIRVVACPTGETAPTCVKVTIENRGGTGDGFCRLYGVDKKPGGEATPGKFTPGKTTWGARVNLRDFRGGTSLTKILPWTKALPTLGFGTTCDPGPQM